MKPLTLTQKPKPYFSTAEDPATLATESAVPAPKAESAVPAPVPAPKASDY